MTYTHEDWKAEYRQLVKEKKSFESYFHKHRKCRCKDETCRHLKATEKEYSQKNKDRISQQRKAYHQKHKDRIAEYQKAYYQRNKGILKERSMEYYYAKKRIKR